MSTNDPPIVMRILGSLGTVGDEQERILNLALIHRLRKIVSACPICTSGHRSNPAS